MGDDRDLNDRRADGSAVRPFRLSRRRLLHGAFAAGGLAGLAGTAPAVVLAREAGQNDSVGTHPGTALELSRILNRTRFADLPPLAIEHAKIIIASTLASAAAGSPIASARIVRDLAKEHGGKPDATIWFDGARLPVHEVARVNAILSDAAASDDSDIRNTAHEGTTLAATGLAIAERTGASGQDVLCAIVTGYEAAGRIGDARRGGIGGVHASQIVAFGGARFTSTVDAPRGSAPRGIESSDVDAKYRALMPTSRLPARRIEETLNVIHHFDRVKHVSELTGLLKAT
jgi:2-methylcitrate dehydratase PrpD